MLETASEMQEMLDTAGIVLTFTSFTMQAIFGFGLTNLFDGNIINDTESQEFRFYTTNALCKANSIAPALAFTIQDATYKYYFVIASKSVPHMDGWSMFTANFTKKANV